MKKNNVLVSVCMVTYRHQNYLEDAILGVLMQKVDFAVELIVSDDCSPDNTKIVVENIIATHPNGKWIKYYRHETNKGMIDNFYWSLNQCRGKYIAFCEGDDYWISETKLQKQVSFLMDNPSYSLCSHEAYFTKWNDQPNIKSLISIFVHNLRLEGISALPNLIYKVVFSKKDFFKMKRYSSDKKRIVSASYNDIFKSIDKNKYIHMHAIVVRKEAIENLPRQLGDFVAPHKSIIIWAVLHGDFYHFMDVMGQKRTQESSVTVTKMISETDYRENRKRKKEDRVELNTRFLKVLKEKMTISNSQLSSFEKYLIHKERIDV